MLSTFAFTSSLVALVAAAPIGKYVTAPEYVFGGANLSTSTFGIFGKSGARDLSIF